MTNKDKQGISIETLAVYALHKLKPGMKLDFSNMVNRIGGAANFMLSVNSYKGQLNRVYMVMASPGSIKITDKPFYAGIMGYFRKYKTQPAENYFILKIQLDKNGTIHRSKVYAMPDAFRQN